VLVRVRELRDLLELERRRQPCGFVKPARFARAPIRRGARAPIAQPPRAPRVQVASALLGSRRPGATTRVA